jgi:hypothetical protein
MSLFEETIAKAVEQHADRIVEMLRDIVRLPWSRQVQFA